MEEKVIRVASVNGSLEGEILRALLASEGIEANLSQEAAGATIGLGVGPLGVVDLLVLEGDEAAARELIQAYRLGEIPASGEGEAPDA
ncbi:MAG: DUF2007 domain-containing protein [Anaerolineales bacterium]|nr:DUF2007 domain-containing protein [Anaerolineales bacterium]